MNHPYLPLTSEQRQIMLEKIGVSPFEELLADIPAALRLAQPLALTEPKSEAELVADLEEIAGSNMIPRFSFVGAGAYQHLIPTVVSDLAGRSEFYTAYTPYQPEISQGILQAIFEYQTFVSELFGLPVANASLYDGPTALAEAALMAARAGAEKNIPQRILVPANLDPRLIQVLETYTRNTPIELVRLPDRNGVIDPGQLAVAMEQPLVAVIFQNPNFFGLLEDLPELIDLVKKHEAVPICYVHPLTMGILESPGKLGAEIVVGEGQPLGLPVAYGGPYLGMMAVSERFIRRIPGRLVGETVDHSGRRAFVLTLQTREQHIRREKATSNICSNQALCALRASIYLGTIGPEGLREIAARCFNNAHYLYERLINSGFTPLYPDKPFFMEFALRTPEGADYYINRLINTGILAGYDLSRSHPERDPAILICATEIFSREQLDEFVTAMEGCRHE